MPQISFLYPTLSVAENLNFSASVYGLGWLSRRRRLNELLEIVDLKKDQGKLVSQLSGGMRKRLSLACALVHNPTLIFLDEPTAGIDPILRQRFWDYFRQLRDEEKTILVTSHYVGEAEYCDRVAIMSEGRLAAVGSPLELRRQALGGDAVDISTHGLTREALQLVREMPEVSEVKPLSLTTMRAFVSEAGSTMPKLVEVLRDHDVDIETVNEYHPSFDEVFAKLVQKAA
jgi:ABC-2 type transport system ATP-binding protein